MDFDYLDMKDKEVHVFSGLSADEANEWFEKRNEALYRKEPDGLACKKCNATIMQTTLFISMHDYASVFGGCTGSGQVQKVNLAYCPNCEGEPKMASACVHA